jgi:predicted alpha/beta superfamily hydrolase
MMKSITAIAIILFMFGFQLRAQTNYAYTEKKDTLFSEILKEKRPLLIYLPEGYDTTDIKYPVIYILDGDSRSTHGVPTVRFISANGLMPKAIVVGIPNTNRERDFLPGRDKNPPTGDGANNFLQFITKDLFTYIEKQYKADSFRILIGHSYGGLFAMHALITQPDAFEAFIMIDPSFWYGSRMMVKKAGDFFAKQQTLPKIVYISGNEGEAWHGMANDAMDSVLKAVAPKDLRWKTVAYANENHGSVPFKTIYDGLRFIFNDYRTNIGQLIPDKGMILKDKPYNVTFFTELETLYYTVDGTKPTKTSLKIQPDTSHKAVIPIDKACTLNISAASRYQGVKMITGKYEFGEPFEAVKKTGKLKNGLRYKAYEGNWDKLPDFSQLKPYATGMVKNFTFPDSTKKDFFGVQYEGYILAAEEGYYDIALNSDDGSRLYIDSRLIINNDGLHGSDDWPVYRMYLKKGYHSIRVDFFEKNGGEVIRLEFLKYPWTGEPDLKIPDELLFCKED